jgi:hypothetical protein
LHLLTSSPNPLIPPTHSILSSVLRSVIPRIGDNIRSVNSCVSSYLTGFALSILSSLTVQEYHFLSKYSELLNFAFGLKSSPSGIGFIT